MGAVDAPFTLGQRFSSPHYKLEWAPGCFYQVNPQQNEAMVHQILTWLGPLAGKRVLDLYCGMGNFSIPLGLAGNGGLGIEHNRRAIHWARINSEKTGLTNWRFLAGDVTRSLDDLRLHSEHFNLVVLDPPRSGLGKAVHGLLQLKAARVCYISCDPATFARDLRQLTRESYTLVSCVPLDMFPQTHHIESLAVLEKN
jgi:23S rRNA (uracil1939-C5)-methyltransferase